MSEDTSDTDMRLYGLPHAEQLYDDPATLWESELDPFVDGAGRETIEEWTVRSNEELVTAPDWIVERIAEDVLDECGDIAEDAWFDLVRQNESVRAAAETLHAAIVATIHWRMADRRVDEHVIEWDAEGNDVRLDGESMYLTSNEIRSER